MVTVLRQGALRVVIFTDDHPPPHVHVLGDGETKIALGSPDEEPAIVWTVGAKLPEARRALRLVAGRADELRRRWSELHG